MNQLNTFDKNLLGPLVLSISKFANIPLKERLSTKNEEELIDLILKYSSLQEISNINKGSNDAIGKRLEAVQNKFKFLYELREDYHETINIFDEFQLVADTFEGAPLEESFGIRDYFIKRGKYKMTYENLLYIVSSDFVSVPSYRNILKSDATLKKIQQNFVCYLNIYYENSLYRFDGDTELIMLVNDIIGHSESESYVEFFVSKIESKIDFNDLNNPSNWDTLIKYSKINFTYYNVINYYNEMGVTDKLVSLYRNNLTNLFNLDGIEESADRNLIIEIMTEVIILGDEPNLVESLLKQSSEIIIDVNEKKLSVECVDILLKYQSISPTKRNYSFLKRSYGGVRHLELLSYCKDWNNVVQEQLELSELTYILENEKFGNIQNQIYKKNERNYRLHQYFKDEITTFVSACLESKVPQSWDMLIQISESDIEESLKLKLISTYDLTNDDQLGRILQYLEKSSIAYSEIIDPKSHKRAFRSLKNNDFNQKILKILQHHKIISSFTVYDNYFHVWKKNV